MLRSLIGNLVFLSALVPLASCFDSDAVTPKERYEQDLNDVDQEQLLIDIGIIDSFLVANNIEAFEDVTGLRYVIHEEGEGKTPELADNITVNYMGMLLGESEVFDTRTTTFPLDALILGWKAGFQILEEGDSATFYIPSGLGYGEPGNPPNIPSNANLTFNVRLINVERF